MSERQKKVDRYLRAANIGTAVAIIYPFLYLSMLIMLDDFTQNGTLIWGALWFLAAIVFIICEAWSIIYVFLRRNTDEFTASMWHAGTTFAFFAAIAWLMIGGWIENSFESKAAAEAYQASVEQARAAAATGDMSKFPTEGLWEVGPDVIRRFAVPVILAAFFLGFNLKRFRG